ncbi:BREX-1 system adenine-specific DNA-methyltransferase PglX [Kribbella capetownensis]|uniref:site-specific DNA-methyltransferase (adenine-specific) n=1 Tax=Kribbella capetownensis TaxID=1572659 RepID=A0A4R0JDN8_9ACTN|nr:BREX-1 system adenine-specific DNA-methyltransferase PglX [Kribbella capetownensis]TCC44030.1 BREX-1 system adenine-specific DNA-methyltransferase PglX [Kribbella capetownensis]
METAPLKSFATWARTSLIREVTARIAVVLAPASPERVEQRKAVEALEKAVRAAGGGDMGKAAVADRVAYTWFNRIIALRFMDANGYTGFGVVSPQAGIETGQPEILAAAKRGTIDTAVVGGKTRETVTALLNGTRRSDDAQGEAYALLLADYCRYWNRAMPFMFEREGDFTELLIPANLLADDSVPSRAVNVLTSDACQDIEVIGWLYQFYISERKDEIFAGFKKNKKAGADEIPAATQLFTPHWIVCYLIENSLGRLWMLNRPSSRLVDQMQYYIAPVDEETDFLKIGSPEELKVVDPACGSGHMLTYAFDLLYAIYEEEGYTPAEIPSLILTNNLYGVEIDPRAGALAAFALTMKARARQRTFFNKKVEPNVCILDPIRFAPGEIDLLLTRGGDKHAESEFWNQFEHADTLGSLIQPNPELVARLELHVAQLDDGGDMLLADVLSWAKRVVQQAGYLSGDYSVVVANPPYMGSKNMGALLANFAMEQYRDSKADLFAMFITRCRTLAGNHGLVGMITMQSWMFLQSFKNLRKEIVHHREICNLAHLGSGAFDTIGGDVVSTCAFVLSAARRGRATFIRLTGGVDEATKRQLFLDSLQANSSTRYDVDLQSIEGIPGAPICYWLGAPLIEAFSSNKALGDIAPVCQGLATADSSRFVRAWVEVAASSIGFSMSSREEAQATGRRWFPENKGGPSRRWYGNQWHVIDWLNDGAELFALRPKSVIRNPQHYFKPSVSWSAVGASDAFRYYPRGFIFDNAGMSVITPSDDEAMYLLGCLNSSVISEIVAALAPTLNLNAGTVADLPIPMPARSEIVELARRAVSIARDEWVATETSWEFAASPFVSKGRSPVELRARASEIQEGQRRNVADLDDIECRIDRQVAEAFGLAGAAGQIPKHEVSAESRVRPTADLANDLVSYAVGCMFGRYSLDEPGLILADQGATVQDYRAKAPSPTFAPDKDNVVPIVDGDWFEDDIVARFRQFLRVSFGEQHFEENLRFVTESLGVKDIRDYFVKSFYKDHVQRYKKRPIYWLFSSPKGSFNALIYMHRYTPSTVSTVLNEYLREFRAKLSSSLQQQDRLAAGGGTPRQQAAAQKEADRLRKVLLELEEYEHDVLYPLASRQLAIDLDDGVKANYPKFGAALKKIPGLEASDE